jgi:hypothetical protein
MTPVAILALITLLPILILLVLRVNAVLVFLSVCLGNVLVQFVAPDTQSFVSLFSGKNSHVVYTISNNIDLLLLLLPVALTTIFMIHSVRGKARLMLNTLPAIGVGLLLALLIVPLLSAGLRYNIVNASVWQQVQRSQDLIVGSSSLICLLVLWTQRHKAGSESKHGKHHKE